MPAIDPAENYRRIRGELPREVRLVVAAKGRRADEAAAVIDAGAEIIGHNYVQEAERMCGELGSDAERAEWHLIGHMQRNKVNRALPIFDMVQSLDSARLARAISKRAQRPVPVLIEVNVADEESKFGMPPEQAGDLVLKAAELPGLEVHGLMTMEPYCEDPEEARPYFRRMRELFRDLAALEVPGVRMEVLSMGMTNSYRVAVEEGANMVRVGTAIFGPRG